MSIEAKVNFLSVIEKRLEGELTRVELTKLMETISDTLNWYEMEKVEADSSQPDDMLESYISALTVQGRSEKTIERYRYIITKLMDFVKVPTAKITVYHLRRYLAELKSKGLADSSLEGQREVFSAYFNWLARECLIRNNPILNLGAIKCAKKVKVAYTDVDIEKLKSKCTKKRDKAIICFLNSTGCRISEVTGLNRSSVDFINKECTVLGKGNKERTVYLDAVACMTLQEYLDERTDTESALFVTTRKHKRLQPGSIRQILNQIGELAEVDHVHPHKFRRTFATNLTRRGMPLQEVAVLLGHEKLDTTMKYCVIDKTTVKNDYQKYF